MKPFRWSPEKNDLLKSERGVSFEQMTVAIETGSLLDVLSHPNQAKYPNQQILVVASDGYVYLVPFVEEADHYFLKTVIPSRKATRDYLSKGEEDVDR
ncbi:BrnT family toxin [Candidatus Accumulibacter phosphatis]|uniref:BrnT family toxin n=2 Tax=Candidatus Accumulibacter TaxID=327159 RepID=A0A7D5ST27_9PROT|nr:BrnT family toxin [Candidatus Accumulibacter phosphatis]QLH51323.1 MAG: BrnT family toxin [Candidatus Accumulibacter cognatus]TMQ74375.1 hypothetical protein ACCUM_1706 [Candidatus Accumulibacter phosphatis]